MWYTHGRHAPSLSLHVLTSLLSFIHKRLSLFNTNLQYSWFWMSQSPTGTWNKIHGCQFTFPLHICQRLPTITKHNKNTTRTQQLYIKPCAQANSNPKPTFCHQKLELFYTWGWGTHSPEGRYLGELWKLQICPDLAPLHLHEDPVTQPKRKSMNTALKSIQGKKKKKKNHNIDNNNTKRWFLQ